MPRGIRKSLRRSSANPIAPTHGPSRGCPHLRVAHIGKSRNGLPILRRYRKPRCCRYGQTPCQPGLAARAPARGPRYGRLGRLLASNGLWDRTVGRLVSGCPPCHLVHDDGPSRGQGKHCWRCAMRYPGSTAGRSSLCLFYLFARQAQVPKLLSVRFLCCYLGAGQRSKAEMAVADLVQWSYQPQGARVIVTAPLQ